jgi:hypothetical protein
MAVARMEHSGPDADGTSTMCCVALEAAALQNDRAAAVAYDASVQTLVAGKAAVDCCQVCYKGAVCGVPLCMIEWLQVDHN